MQQTRFNIGDKVILTSGKFAEVTLAYKNDMYIKVRIDGQHHEFKTPCVGIQHRRYANLDLI